ncbi:MAG TPA: arsenite efflux transporter metallochaperone ArsD [Pirellulaceae bacterium]|nr:arsenite efflux transporter metallochaperone ArsD [Pirellulaceae bacterium]
MPKIEVFDPPMCCTTGVCGPEPDARLAVFAADLKWLQDQGVEVRRYNLAQEPAAFVAQPQVKEVLDSTGGEGLPVVIIDGQVASRREYPSRSRLQELAKIEGQAAPGETGFDVVGIAQPPMFNERIAELVALGASMVANCEPCFEHHHRKATELGIARDDIINAVNVALRIKGQPAQSMLRLADRLLAPEDAAGCCGSSKGGTCC